MSRGRQRKGVSRLLGAALLVLGISAIWYARGLHHAEPAVAPLDVVATVRAESSAGRFDSARDAFDRYRDANGVTPAGLEALSWIGRDALAAGDFDRAEAVARETYGLALDLLSGRPLDQEPKLPIALGAAIEVLAQSAAARGARSEALSYLEGERARFAGTSIVTRIQKNINLLSLEGTPAPALDVSEYLGDVAPVPLASLRGQVVVLFFWAHWCSDCKLEGPILERLMTRYAGDGVTLVAPTQRYGYVAGGRPAGGDEERQYIAAVQEQYYPGLAGHAMPLAAANHLRYGVSTTPTLVLVDRDGIIRLYHPGLMTEAELDGWLGRLTAAQAVSAPSASD